jgi:hypothetical protein
MRAPHRLPEDFPMQRNSPLRRSSRGSLRLVFAATLLATTATAAPLVFGPKTYTLRSGAPQLFTENVAVDAAAGCDGKAVYILVVENIDRGVSSAAVAVNGIELLQERDFDGHAAVVERQLLLNAANALRVELKGGRPGSTLTVSIRRELEEAAATPIRVVLSAKSQQLSTSFAIADPMSTFALVVQNGDGSGQHRVRGGSIVLNGAEIVDAKALGGDLFLVRRPITLQSQNTLTADLSGEVGALLSITIERRVADDSCGPHIAILTPLAAATVSGADIVVTGTATGPPDLGVRVNGLVADVDWSHAGTPADPFRWIASIPATAGDVTLSATVTDAQRRSSTATRTVLFAPADERLEWTPHSNSGVAPFRCIFSFSSGRPVQAYAIDFDNDGIADAQGTAVPETIPFTYERPGIYVARLTATDAAGGVRVATANIVVQSFASIDRIVYGRWTQLRDALLRSDVEAAVALFTAQAQPKYRAVFTSLFAELPAIAPAIERPRAIEVTSDYADYLVRRTENGRVMGYHLSLSRDFDGVWRIADF